MARILRRAEDVVEVAESVLLEEGADPDARYRLRKIPPSVQRALFDKHTTYVLNKQTHQKEARTNTSAMTVDLVDYAIVGWEGVVKEGAPAPCDIDHKMDLDDELLVAILGWARRNDREVNREASFRSAPGLPDVVG